MENSKRMPYALWKVNDEEYKLKLTTSTIVKLEQELKTNLLNVLTNGDMPSLSAMLKITHGAMMTYNHGIKEKDVMDLFDKYCEEGGSQTAFMTDVFIPVYEVSGFFSLAQAENLANKVTEAKEQL